MAAYSTPLYGFTARSPAVPTFAMVPVTVSLAVLMSVSVPPLPLITQTVVPSGLTVSACGADGDVVMVATTVL